MQTRLHSLIEAAANVVVGYSINFVANLTVLPLFGLAVSAGDAAGIGLVFTGISLVRAYALRRVFNGRTGRRGMVMPATNNPRRCE